MPIKDWTWREDSWWYFYNSWSFYYFF